MTLFIYCYILSFIAVLFIGTYALINEINKGEIESCNAPMMMGVIIFIAIVVPVIWMALPFYGFYKLVEILYKYLNK